MRGLAAVLMLLSIGAAGCGVDTDSGSAIGTPRVPPPPGIETGCPPWDAPIRYAEGDLPAGAVSVRLCPGPPIVAYDGTISDPGIQPPEVLTTRIDELASAVNGLESAPEDTMCNSDGGPRLTYWFSYPDGDARAVTFEHFGCQVLIVGDDAQRLEGDRVARLFTESLLAQRAVSDAQATAVAAPDCREVFAAPVTALPHEPVDLASASVCVVTRANHVRQAEVPPHLRTRLERELLGPDTRWKGCDQIQRPPPMIFGYTRWGDRVRYGIDSCGLVGFPPPPGWLRETGPTFRMPRDLADQLDALPLGPSIRFTSPITKTTPPSD